MIELFDKYVDWKILGYFLSNPATDVYIKELSRKLKVSPASVSHAVKHFEANGFLIKDEKGLAHIYHLNEDHPVVKPLKKAYGIDLILSAYPKEAFINADPNIISLALYGSYANGSFDEGSDVDFLIVTASKKEKILDTIMVLEDKLGKEVNVSAFKLSEWLALAKKSDAFYKNVVANHVLLYGADL